MGIYLGVDNAAHKVSKLYVGINGQARRVTKVYLGVNGAARLVYSYGVPVSNLGVGNTVQIQVNGTYRNFLIVHQGNPNTSIYDGSCNGTWLLMQDIYMNGQFNTSNSTPYWNTWVHSYLNGTFLNLIEANVRNQIKQAIIPWNENGSSSASKNHIGAGGISAKVFLLSHLELGYKHVYLTTKYGSVLSYFNGCAAKGADAKRVAYLNGRATEWWSRSPSSYNYEYYTQTDGGGDISSSDLVSAYPSKSKGIRPALILPSDVCIDESTHRIVT